MAPRSIPLYDRLEGLTYYEPSCGCWIYGGVVDRHGYGRIHTSRRTHRFTHIVSYERHKGLVPPGLVLDHKCRLPCCINPDHLEPVTHGENMRRGNSGLDKRRLTMEQAAEIRADPRTGTELARVYGISISGISDIRLGKSYLKVRK